MNQGFPQNGSVAHRPKKSITINYPFQTQQTMQRALINSSDSNSMPAKVKKVGRVSVKIARPSHTLTPTRSNRIKYFILKEHL